ncbi:hypothetical protein MHZ92_13190 [Sporosarcina sp. ACRSL]|uniref:hypothetical protein n=1 Tax=Sporosarcina sp. ACRSL TaxID=2918215 RepID=UPI001EF460C5|nr:hypothetical protein [Sporosarcina sp. ACRSL]MCG7345094.1 hypothetical protein [Sporosarcina sp. ACRSL]
MEQLIILAVLGLISMLFKGKKPEQAPKTQKRQQTAQTGTPDPMRKLKEMTQEMYQEIQREFQTEIDEPPSRQSPKQTPPPVVSLPTEVIKADRRENANAISVQTDQKNARSSSRESHRGRLTAHQGSHVSNVQVAHSDLIPKTEQDLIKGIIFAEILGPPKSKQ